MYTSTWQSKLSLIRLLCLNGSTPFETTALPPTPSTKPQCIWFRCSYFNVSSTVLFLHSFHSICFHQPHQITTYFEFHIQPCSSLNNPDFPPLLFIVAAWLPGNRVVKDNTNSSESRTNLTSTHWPISPSLSLFLSAWLPSHQYLPHTMPHQQSPQYLRLLFGFSRLDIGFCGTLSLSLSLTH